MSAIVKEFARHFPRRRATKVDSHRFLDRVDTSRHHGISAELLEET